MRLPPFSREPLASAARLQRGASPALARGSRLNEIRETGPCVPSLPVASSHHPATADGGPRGKNPPPAPPASNASPARDAPLPPATAATLARPGPPLSASPCTPAAPPVTAR